ncbi:hypothetical protein CHS0354_024600 [Potamilus streckersoni]|uniref:Uncharacterized protein n=1 Tax=Potamilus streckersoni TaxID=2493646 RepID=A0AAE0SG42_9BIVA|nr:hypothetical protein CHS0354_024600 [Potamilus streckersoni]
MTVKRAGQILSQIDFGTPQNPKRYMMEVSHSRKEETSNCYEIYFSYRVSDSRGRSFILDRNTLPRELFDVEINKYYADYSDYADYVDYQRDTAVYGLYLLPTLNENEVEIG